MRDINRVADLTLDSNSIGRISVLVNGGGNGFYERQAFGMVAARYLTDLVDGGQAKVFTPSNHKESIEVDLENTRE